jgi:hypothetical protein
LFVDELAVNYYLLSTVNHGTKILDHVANDEKAMQKLPQFRERGHCFPQIHPQMHQEILRSTSS